MGSSLGIRSLVCLIFVPLTQLLRDRVRRIGHSCLGLVLGSIGLLLFSNSCSVIAQTNEWAWMGGATTRSDQVKYGTLGVPDAGISPGARISSVTWTDNTGKLWLFGGGSNGGPLNDIWTFDPSSGMWTLMGIGGTGSYGTKGVPAPGNLPKGRDGAATWVDSNGNLWLFGGFVQDLAGGTGLLQYFDDLWEYGAASHQWTWVGGSSTPNQAGVYGTLGESAASNMPGSRAGAVSWIDPSGKFWLFGGYGRDSTGLQGLMNDLWEFDTGTGKWTWVNGPNAVDQPSVAGTFQVPAQANIPPASASAIGWTDKNGRLWLFGAILNDLWVFDPSLGEWA
jgi:hypothetical protein